MFSGVSEYFWVNLLGFNLLWSLSIFYGDDALAFVSILLICHLFFHSNPISEMLVVSLAGAIGYAVDSVLMQQGVFSFGSGLFDASWGVAPAWLLLLWFGFCATLRQSLRFFATHLGLSTLLGAVVGSLTYLLASVLGAVVFPLSSVVTVLMLAAIWAVLFPFLLWLSRFVGGVYA
jgi:hypothetical protein